MKSNVLKRKYIEVACDIIQEEGREGVTIRKLGRILECNMASLYRCFHDLDELFLYTGLKFVRSYLRDVSVLLQEPDDSIERYHEIWECFMSHAFENPKMYNSLFFGKYSSKLEYASEEYYSQLFPEELTEFDRETRVTMMKGSFANGDSTMSRALIRCVQRGLIREEDREFLDHLHLQLFKGYLKDFMDNRRGRDTLEQSKEELMNCYRMITSKYLICI